MISVSGCGCIPRADSEHSKEVVKRYDWTYTTDYRGTLLGEDLQMTVRGFSGSHCGYNTNITK
jgi:hypothetical protein